MLHSLEIVVVCLIIFVGQRCDCVGNSWDDLGMNFTQKMLWMTHDRKFVLPRGTILDIAPRLQIPFLRQPPEGLNSDIQLTWHFYMYFDKLGMTSDRHPWPPVYPFSGFFPFSRLPRPRPGGLDGDVSTLTRKEDKENENGNSTRTVYGYPKYKKRVPRGVVSLPPPDKMPGGERATLIPQLEKMISSMGYDGRGCLLRAVCEIHEYPLHQTGYGLFGELVTTVFTVSRSEYASSHLPEYLKAENAGKANKCSSYVKNCGKSLFHWEKRVREAFSK